MSKLAISIPTYNEKDNISGIISAVLNAVPEALIYVTDDNSADGTAQIVRELAKKNSNIHLMQRPCKMGLASAHMGVMKKIIEERDDVLYIQIMDADFSHNPETLKFFLEKIKEYDVVVGSRYIPGGKVVNWAKWRYLLSKWGNIYARVITNVPIFDLTAGFVCFRKEALKKISLDDIRSEGYAFQIESKFRLYRSGARIFEIPITFVERREGQSKMSGNIIYEGLIIPWLLRLGK